MSTQPCIARLLEAFHGHLKYTFGNVVTYIGTTTDVHTPPTSIRDVDVLVVLTALEESHVVHLWRIIRKLSAEFNLLLDARIYSQSQLSHLPIVNRYLLSLSLTDLLGHNPFHGLQVDQHDLRSACVTRIKEQEDKIVATLPRIANSAEQLRSVAQYVYDAIRAYLVFVGKPHASKEAAFSFWVDHMPDFDEAKAIYDAYLDPGSVFDISDFIGASLALVRHLYYKTQRYELSNEVLLVNSPSTILSHPRDDYLSYDQNMPLGLVCVASYLRAHGVPTEILDSYAENLGALSTVDQIFSHAKLPRLIGFNACSPNIHIAHMIARYIKRVLPDILTFCGGPHATLAPEHTLSTGGIDLAVAGEGERPALAIAENAFAGRPLVDADIPGVLFIRDGALTGREHERLGDLSVLPTPDFGLLPLHRYFAIRKRVYVHTTRGCAFRCIFCSVPQSLGQSVTAIPIENIASHLKEYRDRFAPDEIQIVDDNFSYRRGRLIRDFCDMLLAEGLLFRWKCQARADQLSPDTISLMRKAGCFEIDLGIESGSDEIQKHIGKNLDLQRTSDVVKEIAKSGIIAKAFFMLGFPDEGYGQLAQTINYAISAKRHGLSDVAFFPVMPFPGTEISRQTGTVVHQGAIIDESRCYERSFASDRLRKYSAKPEVSLNHLFSPDHLRLLVKFAYIRFESAQSVRDLQSEFGDFVAQEESELYAY